MEENFKTQVFKQCEKLYEGAMLEAEGYNGHNDNEITEGLSIQKDAYANIIDLISEYHEKTSDKLLTQEEFKEQIEHFVYCYQSKLKSAKTYAEQAECRGNIFLIQGTITRTLRLCLKYPELAQEYLNSLPKATMDKMD